MVYIAKLFLLRSLIFIMLAHYLTLQAFSVTWDGPTDGPKGQKSKTVFYIANDLQNGGIAGVYRGVQVAAKELGWKIHLLDGKGKPTQLREVLYNAINSHPDGIILGGFQPEDFPDAIELAKQSKIVLVGWHAAGAPGPSKDLFTNVSTDSLEVARIAAEYAIKSGNGKIGVVIFNDSRFDVANAKTARMREVIEKCKLCKVLSIENINLSNTEKEIPIVVTRLNTRFGTEWNYTLAINDLYFDNMNFPLARLGRKDILNISAGDGSAKALRRIHLGLSQQVATVGEPLNAQGWQIVDELNRAFAKKNPSGYVTRPILITAQLLQRTGIDKIESEIGNYVDAYLSIWLKK